MFACPSQVCLLCSTIIYFQLSLGNKVVILAHMRHIFINASICVILAEYSPDYECPNDNFGKYINNFKSLSYDIIKF